MGFKSFDGSHDLVHFTEDETLHEASAFLVFTDVIDHMQLTLEIHVDVLCHTGQGVEVVDEASGVHECAVFSSTAQNPLCILSTTAQSECFDWDAWDVTRNEGPECVVFPIAEHDVPSTARLSPMLV